MQDKIQKLIAEIVGDGFTVEVKPVSGGNVSSDFGAGVTTYLSVYTDSEGFQAIYVNGELEFYEYAVDGPDVVRVADGRLVRMRSAVLSGSLDMWPGDESELKELIDGYQSGVTAEVEGCFEDSVVEPEKEWVPQVGEWVVLPSGSLGRVSVHRRHRKNIFCMVEGTNTAFAPGCLKPWVPKEGDWVKVNKASQASGDYFWLSPDMDCFDGAVVRVSSFVNGESLHFRADGDGGFVFSVDWIEPAEAPREEPANHPGTTSFSKGDLLVDTAIKFKDGSQVVPSLPAGWTVEPDAYIGSSSALTVPHGWMLLHPEAKTEPRVVGDMFYRITKGQWEELTEANVEQANNQNWTAIRKIPSVVVNQSELLGSKVEYREPTYADLANGPIDVEVCDAQTGDDHWEPRELLAVLPSNIWHRYVTTYPNCAETSQAWRFARIQVR